jgi:molybdenum cofactor cytidylyltransferase
MISAVVLAAGRAEKMSEEKLLQPLRGKPALQWVLESALASELREVICVVRNLESVRHKISLAAERLYWLPNYAADRGLSTSVIAGLWAIDPQSTGALFLVGNQPMIRDDLIDTLIERFRNSTALIVAPSCQGQPRNPVLFRRDLFPQLLRLTGDRSERVLLDEYRDKTAFVDWNDEAPFMDFDVREDNDKLKTP